MPQPVIFKQHRGPLTPEEEDDLYILDSALWPEKVDADIQAGTAKEFRNAAAKKAFWDSKFDSSFGPRDLSRSRSQSSSEENNRTRRC